MVQEQVNSKSKIGGSSMSYGSISSPIDILHRYNIPVRNAKRTSRGWVMSAPHRDDRRPSFSIYQINGEDPSDIHAWAVMDFGTGLSMGFRNYLREYFGVDPLEGRSKARRDAFDEAREAIREVNLFHKVASMMELDNEGEGVDFGRIVEANIPYRGHGFGKLEIDSRDFDIYLDPKDKKPVILYANQDGEVVGIKKRVGLEKVKYLWEEGKGSLYWARRNGSDKLIVAEGEFKAAMFAAIFPEVDVVGVPSRSSLHKAPIFGYRHVLFVLDPDVAKDLLNLHDMEKLELAMLAATYAGTRVKTLNFEEVFGVKDINDFIEEADASPEEIKAEVRRKVKIGAKSMKFNRELVIQNMPVFNSKELGPGEYQVLTALVIEGLTNGRWVNAHGLEVQFSVDRLLRSTGMTYGNTNLAVRKLEELKLIKYKRGFISAEGGRSPSFILNWTRILRTLERKEDTPSDPHSSSPLLLYMFKTFEGYGGTPRLSNLRKFFSSFGGAKYFYEAIRIRDLIQVLMGVASPHIRARVAYSLKVAFMAGVKAMQRIITEIVDDYRMERAKLIWAVKHALPGTEIRSGRAVNPLWPFTLSAREFIKLVEDGTLYHAPGRSYAWS